MRNPPPRQTAPPIARADGRSPLDRRREPCPAWLAPTHELTAPPRLADGTDKAHDDHKYTDCYASLLDPIRDSVRNMTEIGIAAGNSLQMWHDYFDKAAITGVDISIYRQARITMGKLPRVRLSRGSSVDPEIGKKLRMAEASMDLIIDDGRHTPWPQMETLVNFWRFLKPGGYYIMEDVMTGSNRKGNYNVANARGNGGPLMREGTTPLLHNESTWPPLMQTVFAEHDVFFVDTLPGHRSFTSFAKATNAKHTKWMLDTLNHNSHLLVIHRRMSPRTRPVTQFARASFDSKKVFRMRDTSPSSTNRDVPEEISNK